MKFLSIAVAFVSFCLITFHSNPTFAAVIDAGAPPEDAVVVPLEVKESDDAIAAAASVIDATPEETASVPRRRRKLVTKKTGALDAPLAYNWHNGGCPSDMNRMSNCDYRCSPGEIYCLDDGDTENNPRPACGQECRLPLDPCYLRGPTEKACKTYLRGLPGCYWYPHGNEDQNGVGTCSISAGVSCGKHRASYCDQCPVYDYKDYGERYCNGDCKWHSTFWFFQPEYCEPK